MRTLFNLAASLAGQLRKYGRTLRSWDSRTRYRALDEINAFIEAADRHFYHLVSTAGIPRFHRFEHADRFRKRLISFAIRLVNLFLYVPELERGYLPLYRSRTPIAIF